jgi:hypothetical protein
MSSDAVITRLFTWMARAKTEVRETGGRKGEREANQKREGITLSRREAVLVSPAELLCHASPD